jgi:hypothetical protein
LSWTSKREIVNVYRAVSERERQGKGERERKREREMKKKRERENTVTVFPKLLLSLVNMREI